MDGKHGIITDTHVTPGNVHDSQPFIARLTRQINRFGLDTVGAGVDAGYFTAAVCHLTQEMGIALVPGYRRPNKGPNDYQKKHFRYNPERDIYVCPAESELIYRTTDRNGYRHYRSDAKVCAVCPSRNRCTQSRKMQKTVTRHVWEGAKERANVLRLTTWGKKVYARFRGLMKVQVQCLLAATAQNILNHVHRTWF